MIFFFFIFFFISSSLLSSFLRFSFSPLFSFLSSLFSLSLSPLVSLSVFFLCLLSLSLSPCVVWCVSSCVFVCGVVLCGVVCAVWCGTLKTPCVDSKRFPCVDLTRPRVCRQHAHMLFSMWVYTRRSSPVLLTKKITHVGFSLGPTGSPKVTTGCCPCSSLRIDREQHVPDSSNHSLYLIKLLSSSYPGETLDGTSR